MSQVQATKVGRETELLSLYLKQIHPGELPDQGYPHWTGHKCEINVFSLKSLKFGGSFSSQPILTNILLLKNTVRQRVRPSDHFLETIRFHLDQ